MSDLALGQVVYSRYEDGSQPVRVIQGGFEVLTVAGDRKAHYGTARGLLAALTGHPQGRHWSLDRYFRQGIYSPPRPLIEANVLDIINDPWILTSPEISVPEGKRTVRRKNSGQILSPNGSLGIDLNRRAHEVRKLLFAGFGRQIFMAGYDPEDVLQEVYKGLLVRNQGKCPYDPAKSSFGHYVHMVIGCVLSNYHRKHNRMAEVEQLGLPNPLDDGHKTKDVASSNTVEAPLTGVQEEALLSEEARDLLAHMSASSASSASSDISIGLATRILPHILSGTPRELIAPAIGASRAAVSRTITQLRISARTWNHS